MRTFLAAALTIAFVPKALADDGDVAPRTNVDPVLAPRIVETPSTMTRTPAIIATATTGALIVAMGVAYHNHVVLQDRVDRFTSIDGASAHYSGASTQKEAIQDYNASLNWRTAALAFGGAVVVGTAVSAYLWSASEPNRLIIHPTIEGAGVAYIGRF